MDHSEITRLRTEFAEAVGLLDLTHKANGGRIDFHLHNRIDDFLARNAQAEQQEAQPQFPFRNPRSAKFQAALEETFQKFESMSDAELEAVVAAHMPQQEAQGAQAGMELVGYANFDQLDNMLDDRAATLHPKKTGFAGTPVYRASAALATQPASGEPVDGVEGFACWLIDHCEGFEIFEEKIQEWVADYLKSEAYQRVAAPPAAAHGDEAVRKDADRLDFILTKCRKVVVEMLPRGRDVYVEEGVMGERTYPAIHRDKDWPAGSAEDFAIKREAIDAAMRAQAGQQEVPDAQLDKDARIALLERELDRTRERADMAEVELQKARAALATQPAAKGESK